MGVTSQSVVPPLYCLCLSRAQIATYAGVPLSYTDEDDWRASVDLYHGSVTVSDQNIKKLFKDCMVHCQVQLVCKKVLGEINIAQSDLYDKKIDTPVKYVIDTVYGL